MDDGVGKADAEWNGGGRDEGGPMEEGIARCFGFSCRLQPGGVALQLLRCLC